MRDLWKDGIDLKAVVFLLIQFGSLAWYGASYNARLAALESRDSPPRGEYVVRDRAISEALADLRSSQVRIEEKLDKLNAAK